MSKLEPATKHLAWPISNWQQPRRRRWVSVGFDFRPHWQDFQMNLKWLLPIVLTAVWLSCLWRQPVAGAGHVLNEGTAQWVQAARTGRADMLVVGDSVVWSGGHGWDAGLIAGLGKRLGVAGTGLVVDGGLTGEGEQYGHFNSWHQTWDRSLEAIPETRRGHAVRGWGLTAGATVPATWVGFGVTDGDLFDTSAAYHWHVWTASPEHGGTMGAFRRIGASPYSRLATIQPQATTTPTSGLQHTVFDFPAQPNAQGVPHNFFFEAITDTSVLYSRLVRPNKPGVTVTSWGYGGRSTRDFYTDQYPGPTMTTEGRAAFLNSLVYDGSGKLNVLIAEGFNDRNEQDRSLAGTLPGNSPQAFAENVSALIDQFRSDWQQAGKAPGDLSFTLLGMYEIVGSNELLRDYAIALRNLALSNSAISFIDVFQDAPSYVEAVDLGYMQDGIHPLRAGSLAFGDVVAAAPVPEPTSIALVKLAGGIWLLWICSRSKELTHRLPPLASINTSAGGDTTQLVPKPDCFR